MYKVWQKSNETSNTASDLAILRLMSFLENKFHPAFLYVT